MFDYDYFKFMNCMCLCRFQLNMAARFLRTKLLKWENRFAENSQQTKILSGQKMFQKIMGETALTSKVIGRMILLLA